MTRAVLSDLAGTRQQCQQSVVGTKKRLQARSKSQLCERCSDSGREVHMALERETRPLLLQLQTPNTIFQHAGTRRMITSAVGVSASSLDGHTSDIRGVTRSKCLDDCAYSHSYLGNHAAPSSLESRVHMLLRSLAAVSYKISML